MIIDKLKANSNTGFEPGILYCFNYNLKGLLCNQCKSKIDCKNEENILKKSVEELQKISNKECEIDIKEVKEYSIEDMRKVIR